MAFEIPLTEDPKPLEEVLNTLGRHGGPTQYGWHTHEAAVKCWREFHLAETKPVHRTERQQLALDTGTVFHEFLAAHYMPHKYGNPSPQGEDESPQTLYTYLKDNGHAASADEAWRLFDAYKNWYDERGDSYLHQDAKIIARCGYSSGSTPYRSSTHNSALDRRLQITPSPPHSGQSASSPSSWPRCSLV